MGEQLVRSLRRVNRRTVDLVFQEGNGRAVGMVFEEG